MSWQPTSRFLRKGETQIQIPWLNEELKVQWSFQIPQKRIGFHSYVQCSLKIKNKESRGSGYDLFFNG